MFVEVLGLPGAGKSSLIRKMTPQLEAADLRVRKGRTLSALPAANEDLPRYISAQPDRTLLYRATKFGAEFPALTAHLDTHLDLSVADRFLFMLTTTYHEAYCEYRDEVDVAFVDEGFIHRGADAHVHVTDPLVYRDYLDAMPVPDAVVYVQVTSRVALRRAIGRRAEKRANKKRVMAKLGDIDTYEMRRTLIEVGIKRAAERGAHLIEVDATRALEACAEQAVEALLKLAPGVASAPASRASA